MFGAGVVRANECLSQRQVRKNNTDVFSIFFNMKIFCEFFLESPHRCDSNEYTQYTIFNMGSCQLLAKVCARSTG